MEEETFLEPSQENESLQNQLNTIPKSDLKSVNDIFQVLHV
jgi:hypothetical protein